MSILAQLSSQVGDRSEYSNRKVVVQCLDDPGLLAEIVEGLKSANAALVGDCAEVLIQVAEQHPDWVVPYAGALAALVNHKTARVRWEAMHALALVAPFAPAVIAPLLPTLGVKIYTDTSVIVRDYATDVVANYAATSAFAAESAYPVLKEALMVWNGRHAAHALRGLANVAGRVPVLREELRKAGEEYTLSPQSGVRRAAKGLLRALEPKMTD